jgi:hypothetical protein
MPRSVRNRERRRQSRSPISKVVPILWEDNEGREGMLQGRLMDVSVSGARIWLPMSLPARTLVTFNCPTLAVGGRGTVRYCNTAKGGYEVGLELSNGTGWRDQNKDLQNLALGIDQSRQLAQPSDSTEIDSGVAPKNK